MHVPADFASIQAALDATQDGEVIVVAPGTYRESLIFPSKSVSLVSAEGPSQTIIESTIYGGAVYFGYSSGHEGVLEGFTLHNVATQSAAFVGIEFASPTICHNIFENNASQNGGTTAISANGSSALIDSNLFRNMSCDDRVGSSVVSLVNDSAERVVNNVFLSNDCPALKCDGAQGIRPRIL